MTLIVLFPCLASCGVLSGQVYLKTDSEIIHFLILKIMRLIKIKFLIISRAWFLYNSYNKHFSMAHDQKAKILHLFSVKITRFLMKTRILFISWY